MATSLLNHEKELKQMIALEDIVFNTAMEWARETYRAIVEQIDNLIARYRDRALSIAHKRETWYRTRFGQVRITRRHYRAPDRTYHYLLDELLGMEKYRHTTAAVHNIALDLASQMPFRRSEGVLRKTSAVDISYRTIHRLVQRVADKYLAQWDKMTQRFLNTGELPEGKGEKLDLLLVEADGTMLSLQREQAGKTEAKAGIAYEGWEQVGKDRYRTVNKRIYMDSAPGDMFWAGMTRKICETAKVESISTVVIGGDGAGWIKDGVAYFGGRYQLCRYHLNREICTALAHDRQTITPVQHACLMGDTATALQILDQAALKVTGDKAKSIKKVAHYIRSNAAGLQDYRHSTSINNAQLRRTGAIEGNMDKLVAKRMKRQGMSWSLKGIRRMLCVRSLALEGKLSGYCATMNATRTDPGALIKRINRVVDKATHQDYTKYFSTGLPALYGPHAARPWVKTLKSITEVGI